MYYGSANANQAAYHGASAPQHGSAYGPVYYAVSQSSNANAEYELRKRAAFDALNEFFGDAKRRAIDPTTYYDVGQRLASLSNVQLPMLSGYSSGGPDFSSGGTATMAAAHQPLLQQQYSLPLPNLRTKNDLLNIDQFLEQLQTTVYENSNQAAAAGVHQPEHYVATGLNYRTSNSPPSAHQNAAMPSTSHATSVSPVHISAGNDTPALTPATSVLSYQSAHSPSSVHSNHTVSSNSRVSNANMYPTLPAVTAMTDLPGTFVPTSGAPASSLASAFDADGRRRYSGGQLQKAQPMEIDGAPSPATSRASSSDNMPKVDSLGIRSPGLVDPALRSPGTDTSDDADSSSERWVENIRIIETLRFYVKDKLAKGDFDESDDGESVDAMETEHDRDAKSLYPVLKELREGS